MRGQNVPRSGRSKKILAWAKCLALGSVAVTAALLNLVLHDWVASLHLAFVIVFWLITLGLGTHPLTVAIAARRRRNGEDPDGPGGGRGGPGRDPVEPQVPDPHGCQDDFGLAA